MDVPGALIWSDFISAFSPPLEVVRHSCPGLQSLLMFVTMALYPSSTDLELSISVDIRSARAGGSGDPLGLQ